MQKSSCASSVDKNLLIIAYYFPPLGGVGVQRVSKFCRYLPGFGCNPIVVAPQPSAFYMADEEMLREVRYTELHRVAGLDSFKMREKLVGPLKPRIDSPLRWIVRRFSWPDTQTGFVPAAFRLALKLRDKVDAVMVTAPPWSSLLLGRILKRVTELPLIVDMRDPWVNHPEHNSPRWKRALNKRAEREVLEEADAIIAATRSHREDLSNRYPHLAPRTHYIPNGFDKADFSRNTPSASKKRNMRTKPLKLCYAGILGLGSINRGTTLYAAIRKLRDEDGITPSQLCVEIMGEISAVEEERIRRSGVSVFIERLGYLPHRNVMKRLQKADLAWLPYHSEYSPLIVPAKTYEYIGSGTPVLAVVNPHHETARLISQTGAGMVIGEGDVDGVADALRLLLKGKFPYSPERKAIARFDRRCQAGQLAEILNELTKYG